MSQQHQMTGCISVPTGLYYVSILCHFQNTVKLFMKNRKLSYPTCPWQTRHIFNSDPTGVVHKDVGHQKLSHGVLCTTTLHCWWCGLTRAKWQFSLPSARVLIHKLMQRVGIRSIRFNKHVQSENHIKIFVWCQKHKLTTNYNQNLA